MKNIYQPLEGESAELRALERAYADDVIDRGTFLAAVDAQRGPQQWLAWSRFWLLAYGAVFMLAGVIFFFAYNWTEMHRFEKFGLIQITMAACVVAAWRQGWRTNVGQALLVATAVLVGVFLAVFGQVYQTGADAWQLFFGWAALILAWVLLSNSAAMWVLWLLVAETAIGAYLAHAWSYNMPYYMAWIALAGAMPATLLATREYLLMQGKAWLPEKWFRPVVLLCALVFLSWLAVLPLVGAVSFAWFFLWAAFVVPAYHVYRHHFRDMVALTLIVFNAAFVAMFAIRDLMFDGFGHIEFLGSAITLLLLVGGAYRWLQNIGREIRSDAAPPTEGGVRNA